MDRWHSTTFAVLVLAAVFALSLVAHAATIPFEDGFEATAAGGYPSTTGWFTLWSGKSGAVSTDASSSGEKSFRLDSYPWAARADCVSLETVPNRLSYEAYVQLHEADGWAGLVGFIDRFNGELPMWNFFCVDGASGTVNFCGEYGVEVAPYTRGEWCKLRADLDYNSLTADLFVHGILAAENVPITPRVVSYPPLGDILVDRFGVSSKATFAFSNVVYFDDVSIWESITTTSVEIDIKPGSEENVLNLSSRGLVPVCVFSDESFDATLIDPLTCVFAGAPVAVRGGGDNIMAQVEDMDGDGLLDLLLHFETQALDPAQLQDGYAVLTGSIQDGYPALTDSTTEEVDFLGLDEITLVTRTGPARGRGR
jgi:hypothetical protein